VGISAVGETLAAGLRGLVTRPEGAPFAFPLLTSLIYEPILWPFGLVGAGLVLYGAERGRGAARQFIGLALVGWLAAAVVFSLLYVGAGAAHSLWFTVPLVGLAALVIERILMPIDDALWYAPRWGPFVHGAVVVAILFVGVINAIHLGRAILNVEAALVPTLEQAEAVRALMVLLVLALTVITFFLVGSIWGERAAWHGLGIGLLAFGALYSLSAGWNAAVVRQGDAREPWHLRPVSGQLNAVAETVRRLSLRHTGKPHEAEVAFALPTGQSDATAVTWLLRHYLKLRFVPALDSSVREPLAFGPEVSRPLSPDEYDTCFANVTLPTLGENYVGQCFTPYFTWDRGTLAYWDFIAWLYDRSTRVLPNAAGRMVLWARADVYGAEVTAPRLE
jgi:hypothetical protein